MCALAAHAGAGGRAVDTASGVIIGERLRGGGTAVRPVLHSSTPGARSDHARANTQAEPASWPEFAWSAQEW
ncbi:hypothetical protein [Streptomyces sp. N50]|uniref:hypothetical protein n=1 Tax=Streptomyces sp. N50 TaxID=3081765 RepID=UPI0029623D45|nr:hypothetical protein [Streptomyces sp. N50]WOX13583.1 hypothetical protein R2B38_34265 [Streptomyces sp. N50]